MAGPRDWKDGHAAASLPPLPPHLDPRRPRGGLPPRPPRTVGPGQPPARRRRGARVLSWIAVVTSVVVLASAGAGYALLNHYDANISRIDVFGFGFGDRPAAAPRDAKNILIVGSDSRGDLKAGEGTQGRGATFVTGQRSDTVILAHLYGDGDTAQLVSFPRDSWVTIPAHTSAQSGELVPAREDKINSAFSAGGPALLIRTIEQLTDLRIDNYLQIDFDGFQAMVNTLGGVEVCLSQPAKEKFSGIDLQAGRQVIQGDQALAFVRQRYGLPRGDIDRIARQQQFIGAIVREVLSAGTLLNPFKLNDVISVATQSLQVDRDLSIGDLRDLALRFKGFDAGGVIFSTVPVENPRARRRGAWVVLLDEAKMAALFDTLRRDEPPHPPDDAAPGQPLIVAPGNVRVQVFNGAGVQGLGRRAYDDVAAAGFQVVGEPGNRGNSAEVTTVFHGPDKADSARTLAASIEGASVALDPRLTRTLEVVVGSSYSGAKKVTVDAGGTEPAASAPPAVKTAAQDPCAA